MQRVQYALSIVLFLTAPVLCHGQELQPGEIRLVGRISALDGPHNQFFLTVERFVLPPNREGVPREKKNKLITVDSKTLIHFQDSRDKKLTLADLKAGMSASATGEDLGEGKALPAREVIISSQGTGMGEREKGGVGEKEPGGKGETGKPKTGLDGVQELLKQGDTEKALTNLIPLLTTDWQNWQAWRVAVKVLGKARLSGRNDVANRYKDELLRAAGDNSPKRNQVLMVLARGGFAEMALPEFEAMLAKDPLDAGAWTGKALAQLEQYQIDGAQASAHQATQVNGNYAPGFVMKGKVQVFAWQGEVARQTLSEALRKGPKNPDAHGLLAQAYLQSNDEAAAEAEIRRTLEMDAENPEGLFALGILQERRGEKKEAQKTWDKYLELDPAGERADRVRAEVVVIGLRPITTDGGIYTWPSWSPDGERVVATLSWNGPVVMMSADGSGKVVKLTDDNSRTLYPAFSGDGQRILYTAVDELDKNGAVTKSRLMVQDAQPGSKPTCILPNMMIAAAAWHPTQDSLIIRGYPPGAPPYRVYIVPPDGSGELTPLRLPPAAVELFPNGWSKAGDRIAYLEVPNWQQRADRIGFMSAAEPYQPVTVIGARRGQCGYPTFSTDGTKLVFCACYFTEEAWDLWISEAAPNSKPMLLLPLAQAGFNPYPSWSPTKNELLFARHGSKEGIWVAALAGKRTVMDLADVRVTAGVHNVIEGGDTEVPLTVTLRNLTAQAQEAIIEVHIPGSPGAVKAGSTKLTVPAKKEATRTVTIQSGKRGTHQITVKAQGEEFELEKSLTVRVVEKWEDKVRVVVLPLFNLWAYEPDKHWAGAAVWKLVMEKLSRVWQIRSPNMIGQRDYPSLTGEEGMNYGYSYFVRDGKQVRRFSGGPNVIPLDKLDEAALEKIARALPFAQFAVWGSVQLQETTNKVSAELKVIDLKAKKVVEGKDIKGEWEQNQLPEIAGELAKKICEALGVKVEPEEAAWLAKVPTKSLDAMRGLGKVAVPMMTYEQEEARKVLLEALAQDPQFAEAHKTLGYVYLWQSKSNEALGEYRVAMSLDPDDPAALFGAAQAYSYLGQRNERLSAIQRILELDPYHPHALNILASEKLLREGRLEEAVDALEKSLLDPYRAAEFRKGAQTELGRIYEKEPRLDPALKAPLVAEYKDAPLQQIVKELSQAAKASIAITAPNLGETKVTLSGVKTVGEAMSAIVKQVKASWQKTEAGYFLVAREN